jgi:hypothetical protein
MILCKFVMSWRLGFETDIQFVFLCYPDYTFTFKSINSFQLNFMPTKLSTQSVYKLTMLWAFAEGGVGGLLHGFKLPITGLVLGAFSVVIISLIAHLSSKSSRDILQATMVVLAVKFVISPHSPLPAYVAVLFQGIVGVCIFSLLGHNRLSVLLFAVLALVESAIQKPIVATLVFGTELWIALDDWVNTVMAFLGSSASINFSKWMLTIYVSVHVVWGTLVGFWAYKLPSKLQAITLIDITSTVVVDKKQYKSSNKLKSMLTAFALLLVIGLIVLYTIPFEGRWLYVIRTLLVVLFLYIVVTPLVRIAIKKLARKRSGAIQDYWNMLPNIEQHIQIAKANANTEKGLSKRISKFITVSIWLTLYSNDTAT